MGSPAQFAHLTNFTAALRKPGMIPFNMFNPQDAGWLQVIIGMPGGGGGGASLLDTFATIPWASSVAFDTSLATILTLTLTGNTLSSSLNFAGGTPQLGQQTELRITQDAVGGRTFAFPPNLVVDPGFQIDPTPLAMTALPLTYNATNWIFRNVAFSGPRP